MKKEKPGYTFGELLRMIHSKNMSLAQATHYGHSFYNLESASAYLTEALQAHGEEVGREVIEECAKVAETHWNSEWPNDDLSNQAKHIAQSIRKLLEVKGA